MLNRKNFITFFSFIFIFSHIFSKTAIKSFSKDVLNEREKLFVQEHKINNVELNILDTIFNNLNKQARELFDEKGHYKSLKEIKKIIENNGFEVLTVRWKTIPPCETGDSNAILSHPLIPEYIIKIGFNNTRNKKNISRIIYTNLINSIITTPKYGLTNIKPLHKKLYHIPYKPYYLNDFNYTVLAPRITGTPYDMQSKINANLSPAINNKIKNQLNILAILLKSYGTGQAHDFDAGPSNIMLTQDQQVAIIDTEIVMAATRKLWLERLFGQTKDDPSLPSSASL